MKYREQYDLNRKARRALKTARKVSKKLRSNAISWQARNQYKHIIAKSMRLNPTKWEAILYDAMTAEGIQFEPQVVVGPYIVDALIQSTKVIEVDGKIHEFSKDYDIQRDQFLWRRGYRVKRFANRQITAELPEVIRQIKEFMAA